MQNNRKINFEKTIMEKVVSGRIAMKPKWFFVAGSLLSLLGLAGLTVGAVFLTNITLFLLRRHGPMGQWRLESMINGFPWWIVVLAALGMALGTWLLRKYDFSYRKNFLLIVVGFIASIILAAWLIDRIGLNESWSRRGPLRRFYQQLETEAGTIRFPPELEIAPPDAGSEDDRPGPGQGRLENGSGRQLYQQNGNSGTDGAGYKYQNGR